MVVSRLGPESSVPEGQVDIIVEGGGGGICLATPLVSQTGEALTKCSSGRPGPDWTQGVHLFKTFDMKKNFLHMFVVTLSKKCGPSFSLQALFLDSFSDPVIL